ncbi:MAG: metallophosphoesterase family protein [Candidatus Natronoplasma sp.]
MSLKIFHTADLHVGKEFTTFDDQPSVRDDLKERRYQVLDDMVKKANEQNCDLFVIAGDLFHEPKFKKSDHVEQLQPYLRAFEGKLTLILPGNHDHYSENNENRWRWLEEIDGVKVLKEREPYDLSESLEEDVVVYPAPCNRKRSGKNRVEWIKEVEKDDEKYNIGIAHGHLEGCSFDSEGRYFPMTKDDLEECELDLWLLGHVHVSLPKGETSFENHYYSGTPEQEGFKRLGEKSEKGKAWILELNDDEISSERVDVGKYAFEHEEIKIEDIEEFEELKKFLEDDGNQDTLLKLKVEGKIKKDDFHEVQDYLNTLYHDTKGFKYIELNDEDFRPRIDHELIKEDFSEGSFLYRLLDEIIDEEDERSETAAELAYDIIEEARS